MNPVSSPAQATNLSTIPTAFKDEQGVTTECYLCLEEYSTVTRERKPYLLPCAEHTICIECVEKQFQELNLCGLCKKPIKLEKQNPFQPSSLVLNQINMLITAWNLKQVSGGNASAAAAAAGRLPDAQIAKISLRDNAPVPANFACLSLVKDFFEARDIVGEIEAALPGVVQAMGWQAAIQQFDETFRNEMPTWYLISDRTNTVKGMAQIKCQAPNKSKWEVNWLGVTQDSPEQYVEVYINILGALEKQKTGLSTDWKEVSLTTTFNYDTEEKWLESVKAMLVARHLRFDISHIFNNLATQVVLTVYPCCKEGHLQQTPTQNPNSIIEGVNSHSFENVVQPKIIDYLERLYLETLFQAWSKEKANGTSQLVTIRTAFRENPQDFFIYTIDGIAAGFVQFSRQQGQLVVEQCGLLKEQEQYAQHFIQQFVQWAKTTPCYAKEVPAKDVSFANKHQLPEIIQKAINKIESSSA